MTSRVLLNGRRIGRLPDAKPGLRVAVIGAGGPAGVNWCRALKKAGHHVIAYDTFKPHLSLADDYADEFGVKSGIHAHVTHAVPDKSVETLATFRDDFSSATLLPDLEVIRRCQHKLTAINLWEHEGLRSGALQVGPEVPDWLKLANDAFGLPFWLRASRGAGARCATRVDDLRTAYHWIRYWATRNEDVEWIAEEYLPGRDYAWTGIYKDGRLVCSFARERLEYIYPGLSPSGLTGTPSRARVVHDYAVNNRAEAAVKAVDPKPNGLYAVDLREDREGIPRPTEINPGRGGTTTGLWSLLYPEANFADLHARLAMGYGVTNVKKRDALPEGIELRRHIDCGHRFVA
jgi:hypothetical protein